MANQVRIKVLRPFLPKGITSKPTKVGEVISVDEDFGRLMVATGKAEATTEAVKEAPKAPESDKKGGNA